MSELDWIVDLVADYYCGDLCPVFASAATVMYPSKDVSSQISTMTSIVVGWSPSVSDKLSMNVVFLERWLKSVLYCTDLYLMTF